MHKKFCVVGVMAVMMLAGCKPAEKQAEAPLTTPAPVEQAVQKTQETAGTVAKQTEKAATTVEEKAAVVAKKGEKAAAAVEEKAVAVAKKGEKAAAVVEKKAVAVAKKGEKEAAEIKAKAEKALGPPETVTLDNKQGTIVLPHKKHAEAFGCAACHGDKTPGPFTLGKEKGHALCQGCHKQKQAGPTSCPKCHQKKG